ncbi:Mannose or cellobiose epimerase, N-acyl-D-glucosamine 2-epimerase family [Pedococcus dokdonensis]|uniref:Mannose or cellobiose epimerase, N-acyl-D-glucosamine 2-epimerase family n=1 Tax=Pedococcus dokdonensis TaxID=443156 RepID=A0A1H0RYL1_9MICO|nr:AGE family epimerase/isomerase [Pedococcus dokdonensis]SDP34475.1 Mannose or cellobiose epimerase, N-acyl-D-glucosamine 2-epimerase family [Pedococcus dokdonensis]
MSSAPTPFTPDETWLAGERTRLWTFARGAVHPNGGFAWLDDRGEPELDQPVHTWLSCRMTHVAALEVLQGNDDARAALDHGVHALREVLRDPEHGGWFGSVDPTTHEPVVATKECYAHAFVLLAASSAVAAGHPGAQGLLDDAREVYATRFWNDADGLAMESWDRAWRTAEDYRGVNANMHSVEALLAVHEVTGDPEPRAQAARIVERVVHGFASGNDWRLPEHFTADWLPLPDFNRDTPADQFRPFGVTIGHLLEWSRLTLHLRTALGAAAPSWLLDDAMSLFDTAVRDGWHADGEDGFVYTTDFQGVPVVRNRLHWVLTEGIGAAWALAREVDEPSYAEWYAVWWAEAERHFIDRVDGSWRHELDPSNQPAATVWVGKPDVYHAYQAALLPSLEPAASFAGGLLHR